MTIPHLLQGLAAGLNIGADFTTVAGAVALLAASDPASGSFNLDDIDRHNFPIEHDGSLSRNDAYFGDDHSFYSPAWQQVLSYYGSYTSTDYVSAGAARYSRINTSRADNPEFVYGLRQYLLSYGETALYLQAMGGGLSGATQLNYVRSLFEQEKLPHDLGWRPSPTPITFTSLTLGIAALRAVTNEPVPDSALITAYVLSFFTT